MNILKTNKWYNINSPAGTINNGVKNIICLRDCGGRLLQLMTNITGTIGNFKPIYHVELVTEVFNTESNVFIEHYENIHSSYDVNDAYIMFENKFNEFVDEKANMKTWQTVIDSVVYDKLTDTEPNFLDLYYYEKFDAIFNKHQKGISIFYMNDAIVCVIDDNAMCGQNLNISNELVDYIAHDYESFSEYLIMYCNHRGFTYDKYESYLSMYEKNKHNKINIW